MREKLNKMEINLNDYIGKEYLKPKDIELSDEWIIRDMKIVKVKYKNQEEEDKIELDLHCIDNERTFTLSKTNARIIKNMFGQKIDTSRMYGKVLILNIIKTSVNNELKDSIQINEGKTRLRNKISKVDSF